MLSRERRCYLPCLLIPRAYLAADAQRSKCSTPTSNLHKDVELLAATTSPWSRRPTALSALDQRIQASSQSQTLLHVLPGPQVSGSVCVNKSSYTYIESMQVEMRPHVPMPQLLA